MRRRPAATGDGEAEVRPAKPHPDFAEGMAVRVRPMGPSAPDQKRQLVGRVGLVTRSSPGLIQVQFPGETFRYQFTPHHLEPAAAAGR